MAQIIVAGLSKGQEVYLCRSRPVEGTMMAGEYAHKNKSGETIAYRKNLPKEANGSPKPIENVQLNRIIAKEWDNGDQGKSWSYSLVVSGGSGSHRIDMGGGMLATNVVNSFLSLINRDPAELENLRFTIRFYYNKASGYNSAFISTSNGERMDWYMSPEEAKSYITSAPNPVKPGEILTNKEPLMHRYMELVDTLNPLLPKSHASTGSALDGIDDDITTAPVQNLEHDLDEVFGAKTATEELTESLGAPAPVAKSPAVAPATPFEV